MRRVCKCGTSATKKSKFCPGCGSKFEEETVASPCEDIAVLDEDAIESLDVEPAPVGEPLVTSEPELASDAPEAGPETGESCAPVKSLFAPVAKMVLVVEEGDQRGVRFDCIDGKPQVIGGSARADIRLAGDEYASGLHAKVTAELNALVVEDQTSTNGTFLKIDGPHRVLPGERILVGRTLMRVEKA